MSTRASRPAAIATAHSPSSMRPASSGPRREPGSQEIIVSVIAPERSVRATSGLVVGTARAAGRTTSTLPTRRPSVVSTVRRRPSTIDLVARRWARRRSGGRCRPPTVSYSSSSSRSSLMSNSSRRSSTSARPSTRASSSDSSDDQRLLVVVLVLDLADDLLEQVLDGHQAGRAAVLVEHDRDVDLAALELVEQVVDRSSTRARRPASAAASGASVARPHRDFRNGSRSLA